IGSRPLRGSSIAEIAECEHPNALSGGLDGEDWRHPAQEAGEHGPIAQTDPSFLLLGQVLYIFRWTALQRDIQTLPDKSRQNVSLHAPQRFDALHRDLR